MIWPLALKAAVDEYNTWTFDDDGNTPAMKFHGTKDLPPASDHHVFGCPVCVLDS